MRSAKRVREQPFSAHSMARKRQLKFFIFFRQSCAAAWTMAENAAHGASFLLNVKGLPLLRSSGSPLVAHRATHTGCAI